MGSYDLRGEDMAVGRKALFFTLISVVLVVAMIAFFMPNYENFSYMSRVPTLKTRFVKANDFVGGLYGDVGERVITYSSYSALKALNDYVNATNMPLKDVKANFTEVVMNGTINGVNIVSMDNNTLSERLAQLSSLARSELGLKTNMSVVGIEVYQSNETGFDMVGVRMNLSLYLDAGIATWNVTKPVYALVNVEWLDDPYYIMNFKMGNRIRFSNLSNWSTSSVADVFYHIDMMEYALEKDAPSFLMRFENSTGNSSCCGIESLINPVRLGIAVDKNVSYADYCFFNKTNRESCGYPDYAMHKFTHLTNATVGQKFYAFKLEAYHLTKYNLTGDISS